MLEGKESKLRINCPWYPSIMFKNHLISEFKKRFFILFGLWKHSKSEIHDHFLCLKSSKSKKILCSY